MTIYYKTVSGHSRLVLSICSYNIDGVLDEQGVVLSLSHLL